MPNERPLLKLILTALLFTAAAAAALPSAAKECPYTPARGSAERQAIMDAIRTPVSKALGQPVIFVVSNLNVCGRWAFFAGEPQQPNGRPVDWTIGTYADAVAHDMCGEFVHALLVKKDGRWRVREHVICATDVPWVTWSDDFGTPKALFPQF
jgi:hypothetical protein